MSWMGLVVMALYFLICLGPLRRPFWRAWRFTVPASLAGWFAWWVAGMMLGKAGVPSWSAAAVGAFVGLGVGTAAKEWLDQTLGGGK